MNFTPFNGQFSGSIPAAAVHQFATAKFTQNISTTNGGQVGQVVGVLSGGEGGVHYLRSVDAQGGLQTQQQHLITVPISVPGAKPGDPQQTVQIQVMSPNVSGLTTQPTLQQPKYQMAQIPIQTFQQGELGTTVLTLAYATPDNPEGVQIIGNSGLPEGIQVVAAIQAQDVQQMLAAHLPTQDAGGGGGGGCVPKQECPASQNIQLGTILPAHTQLSNILEDSKKNILNNNNNFRIKQEYVPSEDQNVEVAESTPQWTIAPGAELAEYISRVQNCGQLPVSLHQFLRFNSSVQNIKREGSVSSVVSGSQSVGSSQDEEEFHGGEMGISMGVVDDGEMVEDVNKDASQEDTNSQSEAVLPDEENPKAKKKKKYKKKPPKPKKPKPGQVVIATASDGTTLFCCPECHMAYPDKELLEQHLVGHKIERRYICGICGAGLKRREHLERHKMGHNPDRPYVCSVCLKGFKRKEHLNLHYVIHSGAKNEICQECGKGFYRKDHLRKHIRSHATRRAKEEQMLQGQQNRVNSQPQQNINTIINQNNQQVTVTTNTNNQVRISPESIGTIQPEITIHVKVPSSTIPVPVQITVPHHIVTMANNAAAANQALAIKQDMDELLIQQMTRGNSDNDQA